MKSCNNKSRVLVLALFILLAVTLSGCNLALTGLDTINKDPQDSTSMEVEIGIPEGAKGSIAVNGNKALSPGLTVIAKAFNSTNRNFVASTTLSTYTETDAVNHLGKYSGTITIPSGYPNNIYLHVYATSGGQIVAQGSTPSAISPIITTKQVITAKLVYALTDSPNIGPGGGYIIADNGSYVTDGTYGDWRYVEMAAADTGTTAVKWSSAATTVSCTDRTIGGGAPNTDKIMAMLNYSGTTYMAAYPITSLTSSGTTPATGNGIAGYNKTTNKTGWYLPSEGEAKLFYTGQSTWTGTKYSTSSEVSSANFYLVTLGTTAGSSTSASVSKTTNPGKGMQRAVRRF